MRPHANGLRSRVVRFRARAELLGLPRALSTAPSWLVRPVYQVVALDLRLPLRETPSETTLRATELTEGDIGHVLGMNPAVTEAELRQRWSDGQGCLLGWMGDMLAHYQWYAERPVCIRFLDRILRLSAGDYMTGEAFTHRALRGRRIHTSAYLRHLLRARDLGFTRCVGLVPWWNTPSLRVAQGSGFTCPGTVGYWNTGFGRKDFSTGNVHLQEGRSFYVG